MPESDTHSKAIFRNGNGQRRGVARFCRILQSAALRRFSIYAGLTIGLIIASLVIYEVLWCLVDSDVRWDYLESGIGFAELTFDFWLCTAFTLLSLGYSYLLYRMLKRFVKKMQLRWALFSVLILTANTITAVVSTELLDWWLEYVSNDEIRAENFFVFGFVITFTTSSFVFFTLGKATIVAERRRREAELNTLKAQINPHFLMNTIGQLSETVARHPEAAAEGLHQLSDLYRYIIDSSNNDLSTIDEELDFLHDYVSLMQLRFNNTIRVNVSPEVKNTYGWLLPMSLQLLTENALKHNRKSSSSPIVVNIDKDGDMIAVRNNLNPLSGEQSTTKMGLENIRNRLAAITDRKMDVRKTATEFIVRIPIIKPQLTDESINH